MGFSLSSLVGTIFPGLPQLAKGTKNLVGDITGANQAADAAANASQAQVQASQEANQLLRDIYGQQRTDLAPWNVAGLYGLNPLMALTGLPQVTSGQVSSYLGGTPSAVPGQAVSSALGSFGLPGIAGGDALTSALGNAAQQLPQGFQIPTVSGNPLERLMADPGYQFRLGQGQQALERSAAARGGLLSGRQLKDLTQYGQDMGAQEYQNTWNRLANIAGIGQAATQQSNVAAGQYGGQAAENILGAGNARASGYIGAGNRATNRFNSIMQLVGGGAGALSGLGAAGLL